jgi:hypothetical protein
LKINPIVPFECFTLVGSNAETSDPLVCASLFLPTNSNYHPIEQAAIPGQQSKTQQMAGRKMIA